MYVDYWFPYQSGSVGHSKPCHWQENNKWTDLHVRELFSNTFYEATIWMKYCFRRPWQCLDFLKFVWKNKFLALYNMSSFQLCPTPPHVYYYYFPLKCVWLNETTLTRQRSRCPNIYFYLLVWWYLYIYI